MSTSWFSTGWRWLRRPRELLLTALVFCFPTFFLAVMKRWVMGGYFSINYSIICFDFLNHFSRQLCPTFSLFAFLGYSRLHSRSWQQRRNDEEQSALHPVLLWVVGGGGDFLKLLVYPSVFMKSSCFCRFLWMFLCVVNHRSSMAQFSKRLYCKLGVIKNSLFLLWSFRLFSSWLVPLRRCSSSKFQKCKPPTRLTPIYFSSIFQTLLTPPPSLQLTGPSWNRFSWTLAEWQTSFPQWAWDC